MCGICGIVSWAGEARAPRHERVAAMVDALAHRGPDGRGVATSASATFGAQRLAIRGLADGQQPMLDDESGVMAVCNGEIDNHRSLREWLAARGRPVHAATDIAVILPLYLELGPAFVERLEGAFALAVWDSRGRTLLLARDRAGERPLFYARRHNDVSFATELGALGASCGPGEFVADAPALAGYLRAGWFSNGTTPFRGVHKVQPGERIMVSQDRAEPARYWRWGIVQSSKRVPSADAFDVVFRAAVARQRDADVDFGLLLSGGLDSSLVAAVVRSLEPQRAVKAFTVRLSEPSYDEGPGADATARALGLQPVDVFLRASMVPDLITRLVSRCGEPLADPAWLATAVLSERIADEGLRLALNGEGADELFGGYPTYIAIGMSSWYRRLPAPLRSAARAVVASLPPSERKVTIPFLLKRFFAGEALNGLTRHRLWNAAVPDGALAALGVALGPEDGESGGSVLDTVQRYDFEEMLGEGLLTKSDRGGMSVAVELRTPFLDPAVIDFAATLPRLDRVRAFATKRFLKRYALRYLPAHVVYRRKRGLSLPLAAWLRGPLRAWASARLAGDRLEDAAVDPQGARRLFDDHCARRADHARALWCVLVLDVWLEWNRARLQSAAAAGAAHVA